MRTSFLVGITVAAAMFSSSAVGQQPGASGAADQALPALETKLLIGGAGPLSGSSHDPDEDGAGYRLIQHVRKMLDRLIVHIEAASDGNSANDPEIERDGKEDVPGGLGNS